MSGKWRSVCLGVLFLGAGAGVVIMADRLGWLGGRQAPGAAVACQHGLRPDQCPFCSPSLVGASGQCAEHGVPEALCTTCNPALVPAFKAAGDWCGGHNVPESQCTQCNPALAAKAGAGTPAGVPPETATLVVSSDTPRSQRPPSITCRTQTLRVQFTSPEVARNAGLEYVRIEAHDVAPTVTCTAVLAFDENRHACIRTPVRGVVAEVARDLGARVQRGDVLATVNSAELGQAKANFLKLSDTLRILERQAEQSRSQFRRLNDLEIRLAAVDYLEARAVLEVAQRNAAREQRLAAAKASSEKDLLDAQAAQQSAELKVHALQTRLELFGVPAATLADLDWARARTLAGQGSISEQEALAAEVARDAARADLGGARGVLYSLGLADSDIDSIVQRRDVSTLLALTAPGDGEVVVRHAVVGEVVDLADVLFEIADPARMWAMLDVQEADLGLIQAGQPVVLAAEGCRGERRGGRIGWVASALDPRTRTLKARAEVANPDGLLRAGMFGKALVSVASTAKTLMVPKSAVQWEGCCNIAFVRRSDVLFEPRKLRLGAETERHYAVTDGLVAGDVVVTTGSFLLKTEILKGSIGAGCCEVEPGKP